jgi:hypothetical protein
MQIFKKADKEHPHHIYAGDKAATVYSSIAKKLTGSLEFLGSSDVLHTVITKHLRLQLN